MTSYYIDQIRFRDLEEALKKLEVQGEKLEQLGSLERHFQGSVPVNFEPVREAIKVLSAQVIEALGGGNPASAPAMIRYLLEQETKRLSTPRS